MESLSNNATAHRTAIWWSGSVAALIGAAVIISVEPALAGIGIALIWVVLALREMSARYLIALPLTVLLLVPADHMTGLNAAAQGFFVLGIAAMLAADSVLRGARLSLLFVDWDLIALITVLIGATVWHAAAGELRGILLWAAAGFALVWWRGSEMAGAGARAQLKYGVIVAGTAGSLLALAAQITGINFLHFIPGYSPDELTFSSLIGLRSAGLSGHPLRFGTLTMLSAIAALSWLVEEHKPYESKLPAALAVCISLAGLVLSGARGAWISFGLGALVLLSMQFRIRARVRAARLLATVAAAAATLWLLGLLPVINERLFGVASHPVSLNQRLQVIRAIADYWTQVPMFGGGFGGAEILALEMGLRVPNLENEYIRFFLTGGLIATGLLVLLGIRRSLAAIRSPIAGGPMAAGMMVALMTNIATYNTFSWSSGGILLAAVSCACMPRAGRGTSGA